jgi:6-phosphogluconolactonase
MAAAREIRVVNSAADLFQAAAAEFTQAVTAGITAKGRFSVALSGGSTPKALYSLLGSGTKPAIPWDKVFFFWGDERHVPPDDPESNYRMTNEALLSKISASPENVFRIPAEQQDASVAANAYEQTLREFFRLRSGEFPRFDLVLLGIGTEGHTASLFPETSALKETQGLVVANWVEKLHTDRITFTLPVLNHAACVVFLVSGAGKAEIVHQILEGPGEELPAQRVHPSDGRLVWLLDRAAAAGLQKKTA